MTAVRGTLDFTPTYEDDYRGWPLRPKSQAHGVYGTFLNPTTGWPSGMPPASAGYHKAIDIPVDDATGPHPVFAVEGGRVRDVDRAWRTTPLGERVLNGAVAVGHFHYAHVTPAVEVGETVAAGDQIGETIDGWWHVHLEEHAWWRGQHVVLNPLRPGGKLAPLPSGGGPTIGAMRIYRKDDEASASPRVVPLDRVQGLVVPVALASDLIPLKEWPGAPLVGIHVYRASVLLERGGEVVLERELFRLDSAPGPPWQHFFRPLARRSAPVGVCVVRKPADCGGRFWLRLWPRGFDTRAVPNGRYALTLAVEGISGALASRTLRFTVAN
jgi:hypothetical protein